MAVWFSGMWAPSYMQLNCSTYFVYFCFLCYPPDPLCVTMEYSVPCYSISALVCSGSGSWVACLSITLYVHGQGLVLTYQMSEFFILLWGITFMFHLPPSLTSRAADATLQTSDRPPEQLNCSFCILQILPHASVQTGRKAALHFIRVDFRLSVKCPQMIRSKKIEKELPFGRQNQS